MTTLSSSAPRDADTAPSDEDLLVQVGRGDQEAFALFYDRSAARVHGLVVGILGDAPGTEEVTREVFVEAWQSATRFDPAEDRAMRWIRTMAHRRAADRLR